MEKQPFTTAGVTALREWLYQLPKIEFDAEIIAMESSFETWSFVHLELDEKQLTYYNQLSRTAKNNLAYTVALAAAYKKPINLVQLLRERREPGVEEDKLFKPKSSLTVTSHDDGAYEVDGEVEIEITYT